MNERRKLFFMFTGIVAVFLILVLMTNYQSQKRMVLEKGKNESQDMHFEEKDASKESATLLERLESVPAVFGEDEKINLPEQEAEVRAKGILEKLRQRREEISTQDPIACRVFSVKAVDYEDSLLVTGDIKSAKEIKMRFEKEGVIDNIFVKEGDILKAGDLIAILNKKEALLAVARAQSKVDSDTAALGAAEKELELNQILFDKGAIIITKLEEVKLRIESERSKMKVSEEELKMVKLALEKTELRAPIDGIIGARDAEEGEFFTPRDIVVNLLGLRDIYAEVGIVERDIHKVSIGLKGAIKVDAYPGKNFEGIIGNLYPVVEGRSRTMKAEVNITDKGEILLPGMFAQVEIFLANLKAALMAPTMSLLRVAPDLVVVPVVELDEGVSMDMVKNGEGMGTVKMAEVEIGYEGPDYTHIIKGLKSSDIIVLEAHGEIEAARRVRILGMEEYGINE